MDLNTILKKTKETSDRVKRNREPVYIATAERPYEVPMLEKTPNEQTKKTDKGTTNRQQSGNKSITNNKQTDNKKRIKNRKWQQTDNKVTTKPITQVATKWQQIDNKVTTNRPFSALVGLQRSITLLIYQECKKSRSKITDPLTLEYIGHQIKSDKRTVKTSIYRLEVKGYLLRKEYKNGRGGWTRYELPKEVFHELLQSESSNKPITNRQQTDNKVVSEVATQPITNPSSSSSYIYKTTTTKLPDEWLNIELSEASSFGLTSNHLLQLYKIGGYDPVVIEDSIQYFLFDLKHNNKAKEIKTNPLSYFMGILKRVGVYAVPDNYESPKDRAMRIYLEKQKVIQEKKVAMEKECFSIEFQEWLDNLSEEGKNQIIPDDARKMNLAAPKIAAMRSHFEKKVWSSKKNQLMNKITENM